jgi:hypothetical protein
VKKSLSVVAVPLVITGAVLGGIHLAGSDRPAKDARLNVGNAASVSAPTSEPSATSTPTPTPSVTQPTTLNAVDATYLPSGAQLVNSGNMHGQVYAAYSLPGKANADTIPQGGLTPESATSFHVATGVTLTAGPGYGAIPSDVVDGYGPDFTQTWTTVRGEKALVTQQANGYGTLRIDWVGNDGVYYTVLTQRLDTNDGLSGIDEAVLQQIADGFTAK